jgi:Legionella pneumophila major outer membrane protein precursor
MKNRLFVSLMLIAGSLSANTDHVSCGVSMSALYLQPNSSNLYYGAEAIPLPLPSPNWKSLEILPDYHWGFDLTYRSFLKNSNTSLKLCWERVHSNDSSSTTVSNENMVGPYFNIGPDAVAYKSAHGKVNHQFDAVNFYFERPLIRDPCFKTTFFGGVDFARIQQTLTSNFSNTDGTITRNIKTPTEFTGVGPGFGVDFGYDLCGTLSFTGETSISLLMGSISNSVTVLSNSPLLPGLGITPPNKQTTDVPNRTQIVPAFSGKLGFSYTTCCKGGIITLDFGYQAQVYIDAIQSVDMSVEVTEPPEVSDVGVFALGFKRTLSNFLLSGPYLTVNLIF